LLKIGKDGIYNYNGYQIAVKIIDRFEVDGSMLYAVKTKDCQIYTARENELSEVKAHANG
jgi:hypothetical protein